jgi:hypothetical protein
MDLLECTVHEAYQGDAILGLRDSAAHGMMIADGVV